MRFANLQDVAPSFLKSSHILRPKRGERLRLRGANACTSDRSRQKFSSNEYFIAKVGVDTTENEALEARSVFELRGSIFTDPRSSGAETPRGKIFVGTSEPIQRLDAGFLEANCSASH